MNHEIYQVEEAVIVTFKKLDTPFRIGLRVTYKIIETDQSVPLFKLEKLDFGDQCIKDDFEINQCSFHGICYRDEAYPKSGHCECQDGFYGEECKQTNWCQYDHDVRLHFSLFFLEINKLNF